MDTQERLDEIERRLSEIEKRLESNKSLCTREDVKQIVEQIVEELNQKVWGEQN
jgi:hypothetical protein